MGFKDIAKGTVLLSGCMASLVIGGGFVALAAYRRGYLDAYGQAMSLIDDTIDRKMESTERQSGQRDENN